MASIPSGSPLDARAAALAAEAHTAVDMLPIAEARIVLKRVLRAQMPGRSTVPRRCDAGEERVTLTKATIDELLMAIDAENLAAQTRAAADEHPHRAVARRFRIAGADGSSTHASCVHSEADAIDAGALDFSSTAAWRTDETLRAALGIIVVAPPTEVASSASPAAAFDDFTASGGVYTLASAPGFYVLPNAVLPAAQEHWVAEILSACIEPPNRRNIDAEVDPDYSNLTLRGAFYSDAGSSRATTGYGHRATAAAVMTSHDATAGTHDTMGDAHDAAFNSSTVAVQQFDNTDMLTPIPRPAFACNLWHDHVTAGGEHSALRKLAWATLGYQYDWTCRSYHMPGDADYERHCHAYIGEQSNRWHAPFPPSVHAFAAQVAVATHAAVATRAEELRTQFGVASDSALGLPMDDYDAQAGICNFYSSASRQPMGMHVDDMERRADKPVVSLSLGCTCVFLIGDTTRETRPTPVLVRSGDITILSGASRLAFHGVPRVLAGTAPPSLFASPAPCTCDASCALRSWDAADRSAARQYVSNGRININVRQVV